MLPNITIGDVQIPFFSIGFSIVSLLFFFLSIRSMRERGFDDDTAVEVVGLIIASVILLSKVPLVLIYGLEIWELFRFWKTGHTLVGGLVIGTFVLYIYTRIKGIDFLEVLSTLTYPSFFSLSAYRIFVCLPAGCCFGFPWEKGIIFEENSWAGKEFGRAVKLFPSQILEAILFFMAGVITYKFRRWKPERLILLFLFLLAIERLPAELTRRDIKENLISIEKHGLSIWFFALVLLFSGASIYFGLFRKWLMELKKMMMINTLILLITMIMGCKEKSKNLDLSFLPESLRYLWSFSNIVLFNSYIFLKIKEFGGRCVFESDNNVEINCEFDVRGLSPRLRVLGKCDKGTSPILDTKTPSVYLKNCNIEIKGEDIYAEIQGDAEIFDMTVVQNTKLFVIGGWSGISEVSAQSSIFLIEEETIRNFRIDGQGKIGNNAISVQNVYVKDRGSGRADEIIIQGELKVEGCASGYIKSRGESRIFFDEFGCAMNGQILSDSWEVMISSGIIIYKEDSYECAKVPSCPLVVF